MGAVAGSYHGNGWTGNEVTFIIKIDHKRQR